MQEACSFIWCYCMQMSIFFILDFQLLLKISGKIFIMFKSVWFILLHNLFPMVRGSF